MYLKYASNICHYYLCTSKGLAITKLIYTPMNQTNGEPAHIDMGINKKFAERSQHINTE